MTEYYPQNENKLWSFDTWVRVGKERINLLNSIENNEEKNLFVSDLFYSPSFIEGQLKEIASYFDCFVCSPCNKYYCPQNGKTYLFECKTRKYSSLEDLKENLSRYRKEYDRMILYTLNENNIRFAVFNLSDHSVECR